MISRQRDFVLHVLGAILRSMCCRALSKQHLSVSIGLVLACVFLLITTVSTAGEVTLKNDSATDGSLTTPCHCLLAGERVAVWLTADCGGDIVAVQVYWRSMFGGAPDSQELSITLQAEGTFPTPGAVLTNASSDPAVVSNPMLSDGVFNEFRHLDLAQTIPLSVSVTAGQTFVVVLEMLNTTDNNPFAGTVAWDHDTCQNNRNAVFTNPGGWVDACTQGVLGDWVFRAVIVPACSSDLDCNGAVDVFDLLEVLSNWGTNGPGADIESPTNVVDVFDLLELLSSWGDCT